VCDVLDAFGFERIIIETVGVGQSELAIAASADTAVLVLVPESGDGVQVLKAGVMEIADLYVINKADRPGAERLVQEVETMLGFRRGRAYRDVTPHHGASGVRPPATVEPADGWTPRAFTTVAVKGEGVEALVDALEAHYTYLQKSGDLERRRRDRLERHTREVVDRTVTALIWQAGGEDLLAAALDEVASGAVSPYQLAQHIVAACRGRDMTHGD
jgi:LAO/AO transport system kinase